MIRTGAGDSNSFQVKVGVHQGSVLSPLLFAIVMDAVTETARGGLPWEVLYADDLVLMSDNEEDLMRKIAEWRGCLRSKGLKVNTKVMVSAVGAGEMGTTHVGYATKEWEVIRSNVPTVRTGFTGDVVMLRAVSWQ